MDIVDRIEHKIRIIDEALENQREKIISNLIHLREDCETLKTKLESEKGFGFAKFLLGRADELREDYAKVATLCERRVELESLFAPKVPCSNAFPK